METRDRVEDSYSPGEQPGGVPGPGRSASIDSFETGQPWEEQAEGEQARAGAALYAQALRKRRQPGAPEAAAGTSSEELEAISQELKLRQKCQDIAAWVMVDDLIEGELDGEEEE